MIATPWARLKTPRPIPAPLNVKTLRAMSDDEFELLVLSHLVPREGVSRRDFDKLWWAIAHDDDLADQMEDLVDAWLLLADAASADADPAERKRIAALRRNSEDALNRIDRLVDTTEPLAWAGAAGNFPPASRKVIAILVSAIAQHRAAVEQSGEPMPEDERLWRALHRVDLDPREHDV